MNNTKQKIPSYDRIFVLASQIGIEPTAFRLGGEPSILLRYGDKQSPKLYPIKSEKPKELPRVALYFTACSKNLSSFRRKLMSLTSKVFH